MGQLHIEKLRMNRLGPINLVIEPGQCVCLSGVSGSGKTTLLRAIADLDPHTGQVWLDQVAAEDMPATRWRRLVGMLPAESQWWYDTVAMHLQRVNLDWLQLLGFESRVLQQPVRYLSTGERQRLALLRLLTNQPQVLLLDEPTANLDKANVKNMQELIRQYQAERNVAVLWVTHNTQQIHQVADEYYLLQAGQLVKQELP